MKDLNVSEVRQQVSDLLYIQKELVNRIGSEIDSIMRGSGRSNKEIKESLFYMLDDRLN